MEQIKQAISQSVSQSVSQACLFHTHKNNVGRKCSCFRTSVATPRTALASLQFCILEMGFDGSSGSVESRLRTPRSEREVLSARAQPWATQFEIPSAKPSCDSSPNAPLSDE